jgi:hypothetical protein
VPKKRRRRNISWKEQYSKPALTECAIAGVACNFNKNVLFIKNQYKNFL